MKCLYQKEYIDLRGEREIWSWRGCCIAARLTIKSHQSANGEKYGKMQQVCIDALSSQQHLSEGGGEATSSDTMLASITQHGTNSYKHLIICEIIECSIDCTIAQRR